MKSTYKNYLLLMGTLTLVITGCGGYKKSGDLPSSTTPATTIEPIRTGGVSPVTPDTLASSDSVLNSNTQSVWSTGAAAAFKPVSTEIFNKWVSGHPVDPMNPMINVNLKKVSGKNIYAGEIKIRYQQDNSIYEATLTAGDSSYNGTDFSLYNYWFDQGGKQVFSGFFDDKVGAIVLIVDKYLDLGDGAGASELGGEIWFKNYQTVFGAYDAGASWSVVLPCWLRTLGPYDCRSFSVMNKASLYPTNGYEKLGTFSNLNALKAFNN